MDEKKQVTSWEEEPILPDETPDTDTLSESEPETPDESETPEPETPPESETPEAEPSETEPAEHEPDYKALYEGEQERRNAEKYRSVYQEQLGLTGNEAIARMIARNECGGKDYPLEDAPSEAPSTDFRDALKELQSLYPDANEMPQGVMRDFMSGTPLKDAYAAHRAKQDAETIAGLRREVAALKKAAANRAAAPVKGSGGSVSEKADPFLTGFDSEW